tara:strand:- start:103 stop:303 length:201 start_codon:yes stop_codon:yes gene_type:complete
VTNNLIEEIEVINELIKWSTEEYGPDSRPVQELERMIQIRDPAHPYSDFFASHFATWPQKSENNKK